jgi:hypothetical protein
MRQRESPVQKILGIPTLIFARAASKNQVLILIQISTSRQDHPMKYPAHFRTLSLLARDGFSQIGAIIGEFTTFLASCRLSARVSP